MRAFFAWARILFQTLFAALGPLALTKDVADKTHHRPRLSGLSSFSAVGHGSLP